MENRGITSDYAVTCNDNETGELREIFLFEEMPTCRVIQQIEFKYPIGSLTTTPMIRDEKENVWKMIDPNKLPA